jgi:signal transduction histidine kinase/ligand-binding sensor protein
MEGHPCENVSRPLYPEPVDIRDFCDMDRFEQMMKDWAASTGLATVAAGRDGKYISGCYNFTDFCQKLTRRSPEGLRRCLECDRRGTGIYQCHAGLVDFSAPITLEDGTLLGSIIGGQVLPEKPDEAKFRTTAEELGIDGDTYLKALHEVNIRSQEEIQSAADLLANVINMFVRTSFAARKNAASLTERTRIISSLGGIYFCDYYIDLDGDSFLELDAVEELHPYIKSRGRASELLASAGGYFAEEDYQKDFESFADLSTLKNRIGKRQSIALEFLCEKPGWCRASFITVDRDEKGLASHVIFAIQNIQEEKEQEIRNRLLLKKTADEANRANHAKTDFLSRMSHDMRTPLNGIIGMTYLARQEQNPAKTADYLEKIDTSSKFLLGLINDILDMTKAESNKIELHPEPYSPKEFSSYLDSVFLPLCREKNQHFIVELHPAEGRVPVVDKLRINQIVFNLLSNSVKYTPEGGTVSCRMDFRRLEKTDRIGMTLKVADTGIGISQAFQKILFDPFTQENRSDTDAKRGSGLGLAIAKRMAGLMGGTIAVESEVGKGTVFTVEIECGSVPLSRFCRQRKAGRIPLN